MTTQREKFGSPYSRSLQLDDLLPPRAHLGCNRLGGYPFAPAPVFIYVDECQRESPEGLL
jgi:hypothetical protein